MRASLFRPQTEQSTTILLRTAACGPSLDIRLLSAEFRRVLGFWRSDI